MTTQTHRFRLVGDPDALVGALADAGFKDVTHDGPTIRAASRNKGFAADRLKATHTITVTGTEVVWEHTTKGKSQAGRILDVVRASGPVIDDGGLLAAADAADLGKKVAPLVAVALTVLTPGEPVRAVAGAAGSRFFGKLGIITVTDSRLIVLSGTDDDPRVEITDRSSITHVRTDARGDDHRVIIGGPAGEVTYTNLDATGASRIVDLLSTA